MNQQKSFLVAFVMLVACWLPATSAQEAKLPVPSTEQRKAARAEIAQIFDLDQQRNRTEMRTLATKLTESADTVGPDDPIARFVLLNVARETAAKAGDITLSMSHIDTMETVYEFDAVSIRVLAINQVSQVAGLNTQEKTQLIGIGEILLKKTVVAKDYENANRLCDALIKIASKYRNASSLKTLRAQSTKIKAVVKSDQSLKAARSKLVQSPDDPSANWFVARHELLSGNNWNTALPFLAKVTNQPALVAAVTKDQSAQSPKNALDCGKAWVAAADAVNDPVMKPFFLQRAMAQLRAAEKGLAGLSQVIAKKEIDRLTKTGVKEVPGLLKTANTKMSPDPTGTPSPGNTTPTHAAPLADGPITGARSLMENVVDVRWARFDTIDVLKRIDVVKDKIRDDWSKTNGVLYSVKSQFSRLRLPVVFPEQYDLMIDCKPITGERNLVLRLTTSAGEGFLVQLNGYLPDFATSGLDYINQQTVMKNSTRYDTKLFENGRRSRIHVSVRRNRIMVVVDSETVVNYSGPQNVFTDDNNSLWFDRYRLTPVLGTYQSEFEFHSIVVKQIRDATSDSIYPSKSQVASGTTRAGFRRGNASLTSRVANATKIYLDDLPEAAFAVGFGTLGRRGLKGYEDGSRVWLNEQPVNHAISMHPSGYSGCYVEYHLDGNFKTLSIQPGVSEHKPPKKKIDAKGKLRFAIYGDGKLLQNIENVRSSGIAADWKLNIDGVKTLLLLTQCTTKYADGAHMVWFNPLLEK